MPRMRHASTRPEARAGCAAQPLAFAITTSVKVSWFGTSPRMNETLPLSSFQGRLAPESFANEAQENGTYLAGTDR